MTLTLPGKRPVSSFLGRISLCPVTVNFWLYSIHEDDWFSPIHHRLGPGCAFRASRGHRHGPLAYAELRRHSRALGRILARLFRRSLVFQRACAALSRRRIANRTGG